MLKIIHVIFWLIIPLLAFAQLDDFADGTTQNWTENGNGNPILNTTGGPNGISDLYLFTSSSGFGSGGRLAIFNSTQWTGSYTNQNIIKIKMNAICIGSLDITLRLYIEGAGGGFVTQDSHYIESATGWKTIEFNVTATDLVGTGNVATTLSNVTKIAIFNANGTTFPGPLQIAEVGFDNIEAIKTTATHPIFSTFDLALFPNPASEQLNLTFELEQPKDIAFTIYNVQGKVLKTIPFQSFKAGNQAHLFQLQHFAKGIYFLKIQLQSTVGILEKSLPFVVHN